MKRNYSEYRYELVGKMCKIYGHENPVVIEFAQLCERFENTKEYDDVLATIVKAHTEYNVHCGSEEN